MEALAHRYGDTVVNTACGKALEVDVVSVSKIASMLEKAAESTPVPPPRPAAVGSARFARDPAEYATGRGHLRLAHTTTSGDGVDAQRVR